MRVRLKGINTVRKTLADGTVQTYRYAWKGGPRIPGNPGSQEFVAAYNAALSTKPSPSNGTLQVILNEYQATQKFADLADKTKTDYRRMIRKIETEYGDFPIAALADANARRISRLAGPNGNRIKAPSRLRHDCACTHIGVGRRSRACPREPVRTTGKDLSVEADRQYLDG